MGAAKKLKTPKEEATRTEVLTRPDAAAADALQRARSVEPSLIVVRGENPGQVHRLKKDRVVIGRRPDADIHVQQRAVSGFHAELRITPVGVILEDLKSTNGTELDGVKIKRPVALAPGNLIKVGSMVLKYEESSLETELAESLHTKGTRDALTGAYNKAHVHQMMASSMEIAKGGYPLSIIMIDLDHFKQVNDTYGHLAGDYVLKETCRVLREKVVRLEDVMGRFGGEEFIVVMPDASLKVATEVAERIRASLQEHVFEYERQRIPVTASLGVCSWEPSFKTPEDMLAVADELLYKSKKNGRNRVSTPE